MQNSLIVSSLFLFLYGGLSTMAPAVSEEEFLKTFQSPPAEYSSGPLWVWNDDITEEIIAQQLDMMKSQNIRQPFVHPRPGLITPYLSERWLDLYAFAVKAAKDRGMLLHIYDENSYPSGFAGGHVPALHPEWIGKGLVLEKVDPLPDPLPDNTLAVYRIDGEKYVRIPEPSGAQPGPHALLRIQLAGKTSWLGGYFYVDLLEPGLTEEFLRITLEPYRQRFGDEFGRTVRAAFTDEPHLRPAGRVHWTPRLPELFEQRYGYNLLDSLPSLFADTGDFHKVRFDYFQLLLDLFIDRWAKPYSEACAKNNLAFTGHYWEHEWPNGFSAPDNMAMYAWHQMPAIDCLMNQYNEGVHAQFGNVRAVKELGSIGNQMGRQRRLCEVYGAGGWEMSFEDQKRIADWLGVLGVNFFDQHLSYMTLRGPRKRDHPLSFTDHQPWWNHYHILGAYLERLAYALSTGEEHNRILIIEPTTSGWMYHCAEGGSSELDQLGNDFQAFITALSLDGVEYDLGSERILRDQGKVDGKQLVVGQRSYDLVVLHRTNRNLASATFELLHRLIDNGGQVLTVGGKPSMTDGMPSEQASALFNAEQPADMAVMYPAATGIRINLNEPEAISAYMHDHYNQIRFADRKGGKLFHQYRKSDQGGILLLCNTSKEEAASGKFHIPGKGVLELDLFEGGSRPLPLGDSAILEYSVPPCGSRLLFITEAPQQAQPEAQKKNSPIPAQLVHIKPSTPNVLTLDFCDFQVDSTQGQNEYFFKAQTTIFRARGFDRNPWDNAVQFNDEILARDKDFKEGSGFSVTYHFEVEGFLNPPALSVVVEQAQLFAVTLNGQPLSSGDAWWLDRKFKLLDCGSAVRAGRNDLTLTTSRFSVHHEIEPVYVLGDFSLSVADSGWKIVPPARLMYGPWKSFGMPFYPGGVQYEYAIDAPEDGATARIELEDWHGTLASVELNGAPAGQIAWPPYATDLTGLKKGQNRIVIEVIGSLKNLLGPHHGDPGRGSAWPGAFQRGPESGPPRGDLYDTMEYGLNEVPRFLLVKD